MVNKKRWSASPMLRRLLRQEPKVIRLSKIEIKASKNEAHGKQRKSEEEAKKAKEKLKKKSFLYFGLLAFTLFCNGITNNLVVSDFIAFF